MNTQKTIDLMEKLKLNGMATTYKSIISQPVHKLPNTHTAIAMLMESEELSRKKKRSDFYLKLSKLRYHVLPEEVICNAERNLSQDTLDLLCENKYISEGVNVLITGPTGCGKSFLACALGNHAINHGVRLHYTRMPPFIETIAKSKLDGTYLNHLNQIAKCPLLVLDDWGMQEMDHQTKLALLQILEDRYDKGSIIITSQLPIRSWYEYIKEPTIADAIMDRITANAHKIELQGESLRKKK